MSRRKRAVVIITAFINASICCRWSTTSAFLSTTKIYQASSHGRSDIRYRNDRRKTTSTATTRRSSPSFRASGEGNDDDDDDDDDDEDNCYNHHSPVFVWVEDAENGFVDHDENLEAGEVCIRAVKAFASSPSYLKSTSKFSPSDTSLDNRDEEENRRFLCAGALVQRPIELNGGSLQSWPPPRIYDAWIADSISDNCGPNLQLQGALQVLDTLFLEFLEREYEYLNKNEDNVKKPSSSSHHVAIGCNADATISLLKNFIVRCGDKNDIDSVSEHTCASFMASQMRGFIPLRNAVRMDSIYSRSHYGYYDLDGMVLDPSVGRERYNYAIGESDRNYDDDDDKNNNRHQHHTGEHESGKTSNLQQKILDLLPDDNTIRRHTIKRFTLDGQ